MGKLIKYSKKFADIADKVMFFIGAVGLLVCVVMCCANILMWWFAEKRIAICDEISLFGLVWGTYAGMGVLYRCNGHATMDFIVKAMPEKAQTVIRIMTDIAILATCILTVHFAWKLALKSFAKKLVLTKISYFYIDIAVACGYCHMLLLSIGNIVQNICKLINWNKEASE